MKGKNGKISFTASGIETREVGDFRAFLVSAARH